MDEQLFYKAILGKASELRINPVLLLSGIEGLYTFRNVALNEVSHEFLDSLILTIFALRIGDSFHSIAEQNLSSPNYTTMQSAATELKILSRQEIEESQNPYLQSFAAIIGDKSAVRAYHQKALETAAYEINNLQLYYGSPSVSVIIMDICKNYLKDDLNLSSLFSG